MCLRSGKSKLFAQTIQACQKLPEKIASNSGRLSKSLCRKITWENCFLTSKVVESCPGNCNQFRGPIQTSRAWRVPSLRCCFAHLPCEISDTCFLQFQWFSHKFSSTSSLLRSISVIFQSLSMTFGHFNSFSITLTPKKHRN